MNAPVADAHGRGRRLWLGRAAWLAVASPSLSPSSKLAR